MALFPVQFELLYRTCRRFWNEGLEVFEQLESSQNADQVGSLRGIPTLEPVDRSLRNAGFLCQHPLSPIDVQTEAREAAAQFFECSLIRAILLKPHKMLIIAFYSILLL